MQISGADLNEVSTTPKFTLGIVYTSPKGEEYRYVKGGATIAQYEAAVISKDGNYEAVLFDTDTSGHGAGKCNDLGVPQHSSGLTSSTYGWVFIGGGAFTVKVLASCAAGAPLHGTSTGGVLDDTSTTTRVNGASILTTNGGSTAAAAAWASGRLMSVGV